MTCDWSVMLTCVDVDVQLSRLDRRANLPNQCSAPCWRPVTHAQTWASYSALYRFGRLSDCSFMGAIENALLLYSSISSGMIALLVHSTCWRPMTHAQTWANYSYY